MAVQLAVSVVLGTIMGDVRSTLSILVVVILPYCAFKEFVCK